MKPEEKLKKLNIILPEVTKPIGSYVPCLLIDNFAYISGQPPKLPDGSFATGKIGDDIDLKTAQLHARQCGLSILSALKSEIDSLDRVEQVVKLTGFVSCKSDFYDQPKVINGASDLIVSIFGDKGMHTRAAVSTNSLPLGVSVEVDAIFELN